MRRLRGPLSVAALVMPMAAGDLTGYAEMETFLRSVEKPGFITVSEEGRSHQGRAIYLVRIRRTEAPACRVFFYAQQHGDEVAGKEAQLQWIRELASHPELLPEDVDLYLMPMVNPDGAEAHTRLNGVGEDLNRDHLTLAQPETRALHRVARRVMPHLAADSHEFERRPDSYDARGWEFWPLITLDATNHPLVSAPLKAAALERVEGARTLMAGLGIAFNRYAVGGPPPDEELRPSTPEVDDARNSLGTLGAVSFIIESSVRHEAPDPQADLAERVRAYRSLYAYLLGDRPWRERCRGLAEAAQSEPLPPFIATNVFWANLGGRITEVPVRETATGRTLRIPTANAMSDLVVKQSVPTPTGYAVEPRAAARFRPVLEAQGLHYEVLEHSLKVQVEACRLERFEAPADPLYHRHPFRQIVSRGSARERELGPGTLLVTLDQPLARRAIQILEPCMLFGLYSYAGFRALAEADGTLPVLRLVGPQVP
nr:M14 family zinc carboxypeptidase [uncultured Holophaga sp.]